MEKIIGKKRFGDKVDITDPCYNRDVWCRMNDVGVVPGEYECYVDVLSDKETGGWGERVSKIGIRLIGQTSKHYTYIGNIGVDSALAGFFNHKPDYSRAEWISFCHSISGSFDGNAWTNEDGFFGRSGYGDGGYDVFATGKAGAFTGLYIEFISEDEENDEDYEEDEEDDA